MGGEERVARQRGMGKLTVRERIAFLADPGSFHEVGKIAGKAGYGPDDADRGIPAGDDGVRPRARWADGLP